MLGKKVIIRTYSAGVHYGTLYSREGKEAVLTDSIRIWYWSGANSLSQLAVDGTKEPANCKFTISVPEILVTEVIEIIPCSENAIASIEGVKSWVR